MYYLCGIIHQYPSKMARIKFSAVGITNIIGKAGGTVFSRNRGGAYFKNFVMPSNPQTAAQQLVRAVFAAISSGWRSLTADERSSWNAASENYPVLNVFGDTIYLAGKSLYQRLNTVLMNAGYSMIDVPAEPTGAASPTTSTGTEFISDGGMMDTATIAVQWPDAVTGRVIIDASRPMPAGRVAGDSDFRRISNRAVTASDSSSANDSNAYVAVFGSSLPIGSVIHVRAALVVPTGEKSAYYQTSAVAAV